MYDPKRTVRQQQGSQDTLRYEARHFVPQTVEAAQLEALTEWLDHMPQHPDYDIHDHMERWEKPLREEG